LLDDEDHLVRVNAAQIREVVARPSAVAQRLDGDLRRRLRATTRIVAEETVPGDTLAGELLVEDLEQGNDIKSGGDAMSRLMVTMLSAVAEFERDLIVERTRLGLARAWAKGKQLGRPHAELPAAERVAELRAAGMSWADVADVIGCTVWRARQALASEVR
jgi:hypothetical protein